MSDAELLRRARVFDAGPPPKPKKGTWLGLHGPATDRFLTHGVGQVQYVRYPATEKHPLKLPMPK